ncbi:uncharacterized protein LOC114754310 [Neltuma alba]|uniref:uncharacterized protein LOC114754310 n=1 Tax=Neltuma alba TaxID=207710 RepID=UPI0010A35418|nr:uncharacterized protein LOC114754310 [Prosopis alba]
MFISLRGVDWVKGNLTNDIGLNFTKKVPWPTLFGYICWDIWVTRCNKLFGREITNTGINANSSFFKACLDQDLIKQGFQLGRRQPSNAHSDKHPNDFIKVAIDGSVLDNGRSGCGGFICDNNDRWICGFSCKLISVPPVIAELLGVIHGLTLCWTRGYRKIILFFDCIAAINFALRGCDSDHPFKDIIDDVRLLINRDC